MLRFLRKWMLVFSIILGVALYFGWMALPFGPAYEGVAIKGISSLQPWLIFAMLFLTFCKVELRALRLYPWHWRALGLQAGAFLAGGILSLVAPSFLTSVLQAAILCFITPTATAAVVVVGKMKGNIEATTSYTILSNLLAALLIPLVAPIVHPAHAHGLWEAVWTILARIFPMLVAPLLLALGVRLFFKNLHRHILSFRDLAFYLWAISLTLAITVSTKSIVESKASLVLISTIALVTFLACSLQFFVGRKLGTTPIDALTAGQSLGQKNTVFLIWVGYTYFHPLSAIAGGFYSIYHNVWNSYQLAKRNSA
ncbi:MAG: transporter [Bacteroidales bacterium]|nr:transporter [Bacteroidales bacterium]